MMISKDSNILKKGSDAQERMRSYSSIVEKLHVIVLNQEENKKFEVPSKNKRNILRKRISRSLVLYPTNSHNKLSSLIDAFNIGSELLPKKSVSIRGKWLITTQDVFETGFVGWILKLRHNVALETQVHTDFESPFFKKESLKNATRVFLARFLLSRATGVRVVSKRIAIGVKRRTQQAPVTLPVFVDIEKLRASPRGNDIHKKYPAFDFIILTVARLTHEKDITTALGAVNGLLKKYPKTGFIIIGDGPERKKLELQTVKHKLQLNIIFEGQRSDLSSYYKSADA